MPDNIPAWLNLLEMAAIVQINTGERHRTFWNPEMDRYFIHLMMEQISKGNKPNDQYLFTTEAWNIMSSSFNAKFRHEYETCVLKNRCRTLRNLYNTVKNMLSQEGFSWDANQHIVMADNLIWDQYIKEHPDAMSFRTRKISYYNDLGLIFGDGTTAAQNESLPQSTETEIFAATQTRASSDGVLPGTNIPESLVPVDESGSSSRSRTVWKPAMDLYFIDLMLDQVHKGGIVCGSFSKQAWKEMITAFNAKFGCNSKAKVLKTHYKTLTSQYKATKSLLEKDGFSWDDTRHMVTAPDSVWRDLIRVHPEARHHVNRRMPYYKDLCTIIGDRNIEENESFDEVNHEVEIPSKIAASNQRNKRHVEPQFDSVHPKKVRGKEEGMCSAPPGFINQCSFSSDKVKDEETSNKISTENVVAAVHALGDMDEDFIHDAIVFLEDEIKATIFMTLENRLRKKWLVRKIRPTT
ncbi:hypothetical protein ACFE04_017423 [Oxalis oulophora]